MEKPTQAQIDADIAAISAARDALMQSSSRHMLRANMRYLLDYFIIHPSSDLPDHLKSDTVIAPQEQQPAE